MSSKIKLIFKKEWLSYTGFEFHCICCFWVVIFLLKKTLFANWQQIGLGNKLVYYVSRNTTMLPINIGGSGRGAQFSAKKVWNNRIAHPHSWVGAPPFQILDPRLIKFYIYEYLQNSVVDLRGGAKNTPFVLFLSFPCSFRQKSCQIIGFCVSPRGCQPSPVLVQKDALLIFWFLHINYIKSTIMVLSIFKVYDNQRLCFAHFGLNFQQKVSQIK